MNQFPYLYPHSLSEAERLNEEELWQDNRDAEVSHTQLTEMFRHSDPAALMDEAEQAQLAELDDTVTVYRGVTTINSDNLLALSWTLDYWATRATPRKAVPPHGKSSTTRRLWREPPTETLWTR